MTLAAPIAALLASALLLFLVFVAIRAVAQLVLRAIIRWWVLELAGARAAAAGGATTEPHR